jgi:hypothetical protein
MVARPSRLGERGEAQDGKQAPDHSFLPKLREILTGFRRLVKSR